jgi:predicted transglutaminase-like cysteine proteinase
MGFFTTRIWVRAGILAAFAVAGMSAGQATADNDVPGMMLIGRKTSQPIGHYEFCQRMSSECRIWSDRRDPVQMSDAMWALFGNVNTAVNRSIKALSDDKAYSKKEFWTFPDDGTGDCEDYVLLKRKMLHTHGISLSNLLITVVRQKDGEGHADRQDGRRRPNSRQFERRRKALDADGISVHETPVSPIHGALGFDPGRQRRHGKLSQLIAAFAIAREAGRSSHRFHRLIP